MERKLKIAQIIGKCTNGGVEAFVINYYRFIDRESVVFDFYVENESELINKRIVEELGGNLILIPKYTHLIKYINFLRKKFKENNYDIVHSNMNSLSVFPLLAAWLANIKIRIAHSHSTSNKKERIRNLVKNILKLFSKVFATNYFACSEKAGRRLFGNKTFEKGKVTIINNAVDLNKFKFDNESRSKVRNLYKIDDNCVVLGSIGRYENQKNHFFALHLINALKKLDCFKYKLILVGEGSLKNLYETYIKENGLSEMVYLLDPCSDVEKYYSAFDIFLFPSFYEGLGIVLVEAQLNYLPCIISEFVPHSAIISKNVYVKSIKDLRGWLELICTNELHRKSEGIDSEMYDIKKEASKLLDIYSELVKAH